MTHKLKQNFFRILPIWVAGCLILSTALMFWGGISTQDASAAALGSPNVEPATLVAGATGTATITFTTTTTIPADGKIKVTFPSGFDVTGATAGACPSMDGNFATAIDGQEVTLTRSTGNPETANVESCTIDGIVNPLYAGSTGVYGIETTNGSDVQADVDAAVSADTIVATDAAATIVVAAPTVGAAGDVTVTLTPNLATDADDTLDITFPAFMNVSSVASAVTGTLENGGEITCADAGSQVVTCTVISGTPLTASSTIIMTGITSYYVGSTDVTLLEIEDEGVAANDIATDTSVAMTDITAADAAASVALGAATVGATGDVTLTLTSTVQLDADDTIDVTFPAYMNVSSVASAVTGTFENGGEITCADAGSQVVTCTVISGAPLLSSGTIVMTGITSYYVGTTDITSLEIEDEGSASNDIATDTSTALTDITAADAAATIVVATPTVGGVGTVTVTLTPTVQLDADDTLDITFPAFIDVSSVASAVTGTLENGGEITCADAGSQVVTCTVISGSPLLSSGTIIMTGISSLYIGSTDVTVLEIEDEGASANDIATDTSTALTDITAADAAATIVVAAPTVGGVGDVTVTLTTTVATDADDTLDITFPAFMDISSVASAVTGTLENGGEITCVDAGSQVVTCTVISGSPLLSSGTIIMTGITSDYAGSTNVTTFAVEDEGVGANDIAADSDVALTDITAADAAASIVVATPTVGGVGTVTVTLTTTVATDADDTLDIAFPAFMDISSVASAVTGTFENSGEITCADAGSQVVTCTVISGSPLLTSSTIIMTGITSDYVGSTNVTAFAVEDEGVGANDIAADSDVALTDITAADAAATVVVATPTVGGVGTVTVTLTTTVALDADDTIDITFPNQMDVGAVASAVTGTLENGGEITCADSAQVVTCTVISGSPLLTSATIIMTGITSYNAGSTDITTFEIEDEGVAANDIATDSAVALTDITAAALTSTNVQPSTTIVGQTQTNTISFTTVSTIVATGKIVITYPAGFDVSGAVSGTCSSMDGSFATAVASQVVTITRSGGGSQTGAAETCTVAGIVNPTVAGSAGTYTITTTTASDVELDTDAAVAADTFQAASSGGGGGGGGSSSSSSDDDEDEDEDAVEVEEGDDSTTSYEVGTPTALSVGDAEHTVTVIEATEDECTLTVESDPVTVTVQTGESEDIDTDGDGIDDLRVTYDGLDDEGDAELTFTELEVSLECEMPSGDDITTVEAGDFIKSDSFSAVYYVTSDCGRRVFMDEKTYFTWQDDYDNLVEVTDETLSELSLDGVMLPKAGTVLVKIQSDPKVYALGAGSTYSPDLQWVSDEDVAIDLFGDDWADYVIDIEPTFFNKFGVGDDIESAEDFDADIDDMKKRVDLAS
ncbi:hypothetical protein HON52_01750 [Candidatus Uhrbacteria bacterium]|jgi:hypothetical protein|nr:hypothetical protein [Candidatus Uhrbacteria bacterium]